MPVISILLGLAVALGTLLLLDSPVVSQINTIQEQTQFLSKLILVCFGNLLIWLGLLAPKDN